AWTRQTVARPDKYTGARAQILQEPRDKSSLADPRLATHHDGPTHAARRRLARLGERGQRLVALEKLHRSTINPETLSRARLRRGRRSPSSAVPDAGSHAAGVRRPPHDDEVPSAQAGKQW